MNKAVDKLESVKAAFGHWRETRTSQGKIPDYLWEQVKALFGTYPLSKICATLKVSHFQLDEDVLHNMVVSEILMQEAEKLIKDRNSKECVVIKTLMALETDFGRKNEARKSL